MKQEITVNNRRYQWMDHPVVVVCVDGCQYEYITAAVDAGVAPFSASCWPAAAPATWRIA